MPRAYHLLTGVERSPAAVVERREEDKTRARHEDVVDDIDHSMLVGTDDAVFEFDVIVVALELLDTFLTVLAQQLTRDGFPLKGQLIATLDERLLGLLHIVVERLIAVVTLIGLYVAIGGESRQIGAYHLQMVGIDGLAVLLLVAQRLQL